ncbi:MAG: S8 family serine peptidase, partial [Pyrinomonadaceae bacterium]
MKRLLIALLAVSSAIALFELFNSGRSAVNAQIKDNNILALLDRDDAFENLIKTANADAEGKVRVIVGLNLDVQFKPVGELSAAAIGVQRAEIQEAQGEFVGRYGARTRRSIERFNTIPYVTIEADAATLEQMKRDGLIKTVEEDAIEQPTLLESTNIIGAPAAWSSGFDGSGWAVAVLDTGVDKNHSFLNGRVVSEACYSSTTSSSVSVCPGGVSASTAADSGLNCDPTVPGCAHGTHVAGTVAGTNATFSGVAKNAGIIAIQVFSRFNTPSSCPEERAPCVSAYVSDQIRGLERVFALRDTHKIAAVNMSLGGGRYYSACDSVQSGRKAVIDNLRSVKIATVVSSGNDSRTDSMGAPACISSAISVGSTGDGSSAGTSTTLDAVSSFSNSAPFLHLLAPGQWIRSSVASPNGNNFYSNYSGTSMAAPHVAGAFAVLRHKRPEASVGQITKALAVSGLAVTDARNNVVKSRI